MESIPNYLRPYCEVLKKTFPGGISDREVEMLIFLLHENFSQRNLARLVSECFNRNYYQTLNLGFGAGTNDGEKDRKRMEEIGQDLIKNGFDGEICFW